MLVTGQLNGQNVSVRIRVDNLTNNNGVINLYETKYSVEQITGANFKRTLTGNQQTAFNVMNNGTDINITVRGNNGRAAGLNSGDNITINAKSVNFTVVANNVQSGAPQTIKNTSVPTRKDTPN